MSKHTPGPWFVKPLKGKYYGTQVVIGNGVVEVWGTYGDTYTASEREIAGGWTEGDGFDHVESDKDYANARLIAAAPTMHRMLTFSARLMDKLLNDEATEHDKIDAGNTVAEIRELLGEL